MAKSSKAQQRKFFNSADEHQKEIVQILQNLSRTYGLDRIWSDWTEMGALALANAVDLHQFDKREKRYMEIVGHYGKEEVQQMTEAFAHLVQCWDRRVAVREFGDVLGSTFMMLNMGNAGAGQFFSPYEVSRLIGKMIMGDETALARQIDQRGFVRVMEPTCGAGGMIIAAAHALQDANIDYQRAMHVAAIDIDCRCVHMCYLQLALLHIPAVVIHGNALSCEEWEHWYTPAHILGGWGARLRQHAAMDAMCELPRVPDSSPTVLPTLAPQLREAAECEESLQGLSKMVQRAAAAGQMTLF